MFEEVQYRYCVIFGAQHGEEANVALHTCTIDSVLRKACSVS